MDLTAAFLGLLFLLPVLMILVLVVAWKLGRPVFFTQLRPGLHGRPFRMIKFRTMTDACDKDGRLLPNEKRRTKIGDFLRSFSLDEIPELFNVLKGDMSLVGPRPLLMEYLPLYNDEQRRRHEDRPGITGWAQVNGRNAVTWEQRFEHDLWYVKNRSFWLDLKILGMTIAKVVKREGINTHGGSFIEPFSNIKL
ncbi:MAG: sugar transferase [Acidobacteriota bacterium]|nr:sugar transferase [Acidobacteriota bacterium]